MPASCDDMSEANKIVQESADEKWKEAMGWKWESRAVVVNWEPDITCAVVNCETGEVWAAWKIIEIDVPNMENM